MNKIFTLNFLLLFCMATMAGAAKKVHSPNKQLTLEQADGQYVIKYKKAPVLHIEANGYGLGEEE